MRHMSSKRRVTEERLYQAILGLERRSRTHAIKKEICLHPRLSKENLLLWGLASQPKEGSTVVRHFPGPPKTLPLPEALKGESPTLGSSQPKECQLWCFTCRAHERKMSPSPKGSKGESFAVASSQTNAGATVVCHFPGPQMENVTSTDGSERRISYIWGVASQKVRTPWLA